MTLHRFNTGLAILVLTFGLYILLSPFVPDVWFKFHHPTVAPYSGALASFYHLPASQRAPKDNRLVIPFIALNQTIKEGRDISVLNHNGVWRIPHGSDDPRHGNMVLIGHRFMYTTPYGTFYNLGKLRIGDRLALYWRGKEYLYRVKTVRVANPNDRTVEAPSTTPQLTLYTCTPLLTARDRLVVVAQRQAS